MKTMLSVLAALLLTSTAQAKPVPAGFHREKVMVGDVAYNVYRGGHGAPLVLLHGYAESALMWAPAMNALKDRFSIIVPDLRGAGETDAPAGGYGKLTMAADIKALLDHYGIARARVVGHDIGLMVAYALAAKYPESVEKLVLMDAFVPGVGPGDAIYNSPDIWHFRFHGKYAEALVKGRERVYLDALWDGFSADPRTFPEADKKYYVAQYARPGRMHAGFEWFKAFPKDAEDNRVLAQTKLPMPLLTIGGAAAMGQPLAETAKVISEHPTTVVLPNSGHWLLEEKPAETIQALRDFL